ncbi:hypothetical protein JTB14_030977 [Gonioctena quinquepunctata]|nr:hypothetical protein JTB14_030977 [Gonioctena quinquepunctata]
MFRNLSNLEELRLDGNALGHFIPGLFGGLDNLEILNLSKNPRLFQGSRNLNLFNLRRLTTIILNNTALGDNFDYRSLLADNPYLHTIELNYNSFSCTALLEMLRYFKQINPENNKNYNYFINFAAEDPRYDINNVAGIVCDYRNQ